MVNTAVVLKAAHQRNSISKRHFKGYYLSGYINITKGAKIGQTHCSVKYLMLARPATKFEQLSKETLLLKH